MQCGADVCSVSRATSQRLGILRKSWRVFHDRSLGRCFLGFVLPVLECCSAVWCSAANTHLKHLKLLLPVRVTGGALVAHRFTYAHPRCRTSQYRRTFIRLSVSLWNDLAYLVLDGVGLVCFKSRANAFLLA